MRKLGLPEPPRAHAPPHVLFDSQHYSTLSHSSLGSYFSFLFFTFLRQFNLIYLQFKSAPRKRHWLILTYKQNCLSFYLDETHASEMKWIRSGPPSECAKRSILGRDISEKTNMLKKGPFKQFLLDWKCTVTTFLKTQRSEMNRVSEVRSSFPPPGHYHFRFKVGPCPGFCEL